MSSKEYIKLYDSLTDNQRDIMADLWMTGINQDGHVYVTYDDVEKSIVSLIKEERKRQK